MGNTHTKPHPRLRNKKQVRWKAADRPSPPGKPHLASDSDLTPDLVTIQWAKPVRDGGSPITGYLVEHRRAGSPHWVRATPLLVPFPELTISGLEPGWRYQFRVSAENAVGLSDTSEISEPLTVTLQKFAITAPRFTQELEDAIAMENEKIEFTVHFLGQPPPKICWFKDGFEIFSSRRTRILTEPDKSVLTIHQCALSDEGEIRCTATNRAGHSSTKAKLTLEAPPSIRLPRQYDDGLLFEIGEVIRLKVSIAGRPTPLVFWNHNGESIQNNDRYEIEYVDKSSILKLGEAVRSDRGEYQVKAVNKLGESFASFLVTVTDKPSPPGKARVIMTLGKSVTLSWSTPNDDGGCKIGNYIVEYYRLGWNVWLKAATSRQLTTMLGDLIEGSEYKFRIKAESPYGISDPGEESEVVFIPDPKRGIITPQIRSRSQPRDIIEDVMAPVATKRKTKAHPRSQSSSRAETLQHSNINSFIQEAGIPKRPERSKIKSPPKTPEMSPLINRKPITSINPTMLDRASISRELAYGSPDIKIKKTEISLNNYLHTGNSNTSRSNSPILNREIENATDNQHIIKQLNSQTPSPTKIDETKKTPSPNTEKRNQPRENNENFTGSSEFMLVLYPDENDQGSRKLSSDIRFEFEESSIPPPLSLSAPELGTEPPVFENLKLSASSTELLHERAMIRLNEAAAIEEAELDKRRKANQNNDQFIDIPKIQINSKDNQEIVGLERINSFKRRHSAGGLTQQQLWAQRRYSLRNTNDLSDINDNKLNKNLNNIENKRELMMLRQRSESEEREEEEFEKVRAKMALQGQSSFEKRSIEVVEEENWLDDYEESYSEEETESSENERNEIENKFEIMRIYSDEDEELDHPEMMSNRKLINDKPFEILTKKNKLPDPNFIPKPILKKSENIEEKIKLETVISVPPIKIHKQFELDRKKRQRSQSVAQPTLTETLKTNSLPNTGQQRQRSFSLVPNQDITMRARSNSLTNQDLSSILQSVEKLSRPDSPGHNKSISKGLSISAVAQISGITAASIVIPDRLLNQQEAEEEAKVAVDHYGDIVKTYSQKRKNIPQSTNINRESLQKTPESNKQNLEQTEIQTQQINYDEQPRRNSVTAQNNLQTSKTQTTSSTMNTNSTLRKSSLSSEEDNKTKWRKGSLTIVDNMKETMPINSRSPSPQRQQFMKEKSSSPGNKTTTRLGRATTPPSQKNRSGSVSRSPKRSKRTPSKSPARVENWSDLRSQNAKTQRKSSPLPSPRQQTNTLIKRKSPSPIPYLRPRPMLREIMTQTSIGLEMEFTRDSGTSTPSGISERQQQLITKAGIQVRSFMDYITDLAMFMVACWLYLFSNELLAIPVLLVMVCRQLKDEILKRIPKWILRRFKAKKKKH